MKKVVSLSVVVCLIFGNVVFAGGWFLGASSWAEDELLQSVDNGIISYDDFTGESQGDYSQSISRQDFAMLAVRLYVAMTGVTPKEASKEASKKAPKEASKLDSPATHLFVEI